MAKVAGAPPDKNDPGSWIVWHFTHVDNLAKIAATGRLLSDRSAAPNVNVAYASVKDNRRRFDVTPDSQYPASTVSDHVPFYIAPKSPMLYVVQKGHSSYQGGVTPLVFLGCCLSDIIDSGATWCASDGNAGAAITRFSRDLGTLGDFVDFNLLRQKMWKNTPDDMDRMRRRAAEILVHNAVPLELVSIIIAYDQQHLEAAQRAMANVGGFRQYHITTDLYY